ncbi:hemicentin-2-like isoform X2 [Betta splendens]|uniref:B-cell receptor CD22 n=1 Tax=Betta splendens TaxID=158456 RepID=A0A9W2Y0Q3_BETSP|nr:hemicentin-2-like isoform X2 [Betta splendens]
MAASAAGFLLLLSASVVRGENGWSVTYTNTDICAVEGKTVQMSCSYKYPYSFKYTTISIEREFWFTRMIENEYVDLKSDPQYDHRVEYQCWSRSCTLTITNVRKSDSGVYRFRFMSNHPEGKFTGDPGVTLSVTDDPNLHVNKYNNGLYCSFTVYSKCLLPDQRSYIWYKNGHELPEQTSYYLKNVDCAHSYSCALRGHEAFPAPSVCVSGQTCNKVIYTDRSICAVKGSSVEISCTYNSHSGSITSKFWFRSDRSGQSPSQPQDLRTDVQFTGRVQVLEAATGGSTLRISDVTETDSGQYGFTFRAGGFEWGHSLSGSSLTVTDLQVLVWRYSTWRILQCSSSCRFPDHSSFIWYKNGDKMKENQKEISAYSSSADSYSCALSGREDFPSASVCVYGETCNKVIYTDRSICAVKGSSVEISCTYNSYSGSITSKYWFRSDSSLQWQSSSQPQDLRTGRVQVLEAATGGSTLRISDVTETDSGQYGFTFRAGGFEWGRSLSGPSLTVTALQVQVNRVMAIDPSSVHVELKCQSSCRPRSSSYVWFQNGSPTGSTTLYFTTWINSGDNFSCAFEGHENLCSPLVYAPKAPLLKLSPSGDILENSPVTLTCSSDANPAANYTWYRDSHPEFTHEGPQLVFSSIQSNHSGRFYCEAENQLGRRRSESISVDVRYAPDVPSVSVVPSGDIVKNSPVTLTCSSDANPAANYTWYRDSHPEFTHEGPQLVFSSIQSSDSGRFYCEAENQLGRRRSEFVSINVEYAPDVPSVSVVSSGEIVEGSSVTLTCSSDANPAANYTWYKEDEQAAKASGQNFTISDVRAEDGGKYSCEAQNSRGRRRSVIHVTVVTGWMKSAAAGSVSVVIVLLVFLVVFLWIRKKRFFQRTPGHVELNAGPEYEVPPAAAPRNPAAPQDDLFYASISFSKSQDEALYSNVRAAPLQRRGAEEEEDVEYTMVTAQGLGASSQPRRREAEEDSFALYSTVNKAQRA